MDMNVIYVGLDVDDTQYHGSALNKDTGEVITFQCRPTLAGLVKQLAKIDQAFPSSSLSLCYEASILAIPCIATSLHTVITAMWWLPAAYPVQGEGRSRRIASMRHSWRNSKPMAY